MKRPSKLAAGIVVAVLAVPAGIAIGEYDPVLDESDAVAASKCPEAAAFMESIGFENETFAPGCPDVGELRAKLTNPDPTVPNLKDLPNAKRWVEENDIPVIEVPK